MENIGIECKVKGINSNDIENIDISSIGIIRNDTYYDILIEDTTEYIENTLYLTGQIEDIELTEENSHTDTIIISFMSDVLDKIECNKIICTLLNRNNFPIYEKYSYGGICAPIDYEIELL